MSPLPWMIDELAHAGAEHLDAHFVEGYDRKQGSIPDDAAAQDVHVLSEHGIGADATVLDLGAGTGRFATALAPHVAHVIAVDVSPVMLDAARRRATEAGLGNVTFVRGGLLSYEHHAPPVDAVHTRNALHQLPDFWKGIALARMAQVLRPGGVLRLRDLIYDFEPHEAGEVFDAWLGNAASDPAAGYTSDDLAEHIRTEHSTFRWLLDRMLDATEFDIVDFSSRARVYGAYTCIRR